MTALIITQRPDVTADRVIIELEELGEEVVRLDMADFPDTAGLSAVIVDGVWVGHLHVGDRVAALDEITGVYYRRPSVPRTTGLYGCEGADQFVEQEIRLGFGGLLAALPEELWLGHPRTLLGVQRSKPWQLATAADAGLSIPETMVTGDSADAAAFADDVGGTVAVKSFGIGCYQGPDGEVASILTRRMTADELRASDMAGVPHQVQRWINADHAVRLTVVDNELFAAEIHFGTPATRVDWRADPDSLRYRRVEPPVSVAVGVRRLMRALRLRYGALDFMVDAHGEWWFLEINANGQWAWIPAVADDIASAISHALTRVPGAANGSGPTRQLVGIH